MKRLAALLLLLLALASCSSFDDTLIWDELKEHEERILKLETLCKQLNTNVTSLQTALEALQNKDFVTNVAPIKEQGKEIGYTITFAKSGSITIYHGADAYLPQISAKQDEDNRYYWTLDGEWLTDANGNKVPATGKDGMDGEPGVPGEPGTPGETGAPGKDGLTPQFAIIDGYWYISYGEDDDWKLVGKATGDPGAAGESGSDAVSIIKSVSEDSENVYFTLADGAVITLPKRNSDIIVFEDLNAKSLCCKYWDTNYDGELSYSEAAAVTSISGVFSNAKGAGNTNIIAFTELKYFTGLTEIPSSAFWKCTALWKVALPETIVSIGDYAFRDCANLSYINIPTAVKSIGAMAFSNTSISRLQIHSGVTSFGSSVFEDAVMDYIIFDAPVAQAQSNSSGYFKELECAEMVFNTDVPDGNFFRDSKIEKITFSGNATRIGEGAFAPKTSVDYVSVEVVVLDECVKNIGSQAFNNKSLKEVYSKSAVPPVCEGAVLFSSDATFTIYVPVGSANSYKDAAGWMNYSSRIVEKEF